MRLTNALEWVLNILSTRGKSTMTPKETAKAIAKAKKLKRWKEDRAYKRENEPKFVAAEQASRKRYGDFTKAAREFAKRYPKEFEAFQRERQQGSQSLRSLPTAQRMAAPSAPHMPAKEKTSPKAGPDWLSMLGVPRN
jgi:hypothetical protein